MELEKVLQVAVLALLFALLIIEFIKKDLRIETELISKQSLVDLKNDELFKTLFLNSFNDPSFIKRDKIRLHAHIEKFDKNALLQKQKLFEKSKEKGSLLNKEISYSIYRLGKTEIQKILDFFPGQEVAYFVFEAQVYSDYDKHRFIAYRIFPANQSKQRLILDWAALKKTFQGLEQQPDVRRDSTSLGDGNYEEGRDYLLLKPSPPASSSIE